MKIGIIGGLGPLATVKFMDLLNEKLDDNKEIEIDVINDPTTPDRTQYILDNSKENPINNILSMVHNLEKLNVDVIVMPCNTASYFYKEILNNTNIKFINIVEETVKYLNDINVKKVGLLATFGTTRSKIYEDLLNNYNIECEIPNDEDLEIVAKVIYDGVKSNKKIDLTSFYNIIDKFKNDGCEKVIFGCTELSALRQIEKLNDDYIVDAMNVLADNTINYINKIDIN